MAARRHKEASPPSSSTPLRNNPSPTPSPNATPPTSITDNPTASLLPKKSSSSSKLFNNQTPYFDSTADADGDTEDAGEVTLPPDKGSLSSPATSPGGGQTHNGSSSEKDLPPPYQSVNSETKSSKWATGTEEHVRETWGKKIEFLLAVVGFAVDLGNVWRFPYICYQNGGGAFLVPYVIMLVFGGLPLFFMELALGQYHRNGCLTVWKRVCPMMKGIGYAICIIDLYMAMYYNTILAWSLYYLVASFSSELPWTSCDNEWNSANCTLTEDVGNMSIIDKDLAVSPAKEFFRNEVLEVNKSSGLGDIGPIKPSLAICLFIVFILVYFSLWKGVKSTGKAVWVTAILPYFVLIILLIRGVTLPGAMKGIMYYITPRFEMLHKPKVWVDAATQIFFSLGPGFGTLLALSSYNKFHNNCYRDALITSSINCLTSFLAGFVIFSVLGYLSFVQNKDISKVGVQGPGLVFTIYPEAIATMSGSVFWSIIFFLMLINLGLDSTFGGLEAMITGLCDEYPKMFGRHRELFVGGLLIFIYLCALPTTTYGGMHIVDLLNIFGTGNPILFIVFVEATAVCWFYGAERFANDIHKMLGFRPGNFWIVCWKYISPTFIFVLFLCSFIFSGEEEEEAEGGTESPFDKTWVLILGWLLTSSSIVCIPLYMIYLFIITPGTAKERLKKLIKPEDFTHPEANSMYATHV